MEGLAQQVIQLPGFQPRQLDGMLVVEREKRGLVVQFDRENIGHGVVPGEQDVDGCGHGQFRLPAAVGFGMMAVAVVFLAS